MGGCGLYGMEFHCWQDELAYPGVQKSHFYAVTPTGTHQHLYHGVGILRVRYADLHRRSHIAEIAWRGLCQHRKAAWLLRFLRAFALDRTGCGPREDRSWRPLGI